MFSGIDILRAKWGQYFMSTTWGKLGDLGLNNTLLNENNNLLTISKLFQS